MQIINETIENLFREIHLDTAHISSDLERLANTDSKYLRELKVNVTNALTGKFLSKKEVYLIGMAVAFNEKIKVLQASFENMAKQAGATEAEIMEVISLTSLMNINNIYYRFRHFMDNEFYTNTPAGIKMGLMLNPVLGKEFFEVISLVVSAVNGCAMCVTSHEEALRKQGTSKERILEAIREGAVLKGFFQFF